ncbi:MAG TPA: hypothetical protein DCZ40_13535 [Lachnospiraceae bacterium]|nr:hypothetical protein [Lachnospiraceae bacterium]
MLKTIMKYIGKLGAGIVIGVLMLIAVYALPIGRMKENVARSSEVFNYERMYPQIIFGYKYMQLDNYTDSLMLGEAIYEGTENILDKAMSNYRIASDELPQDMTVTNYANDAPYDFYPVSYERYWHGYLVPLKLLLLFFDYPDIRVLNFLLQNFLLYIVLRKFHKNNLGQYMPAFLMAVFVLNPLTAALSLQFSSVYYIILFSVIYLLHLEEKKEASERKTDNLFFTVGILTSYFDFLTYPLAAFGVLAVTYLNLNREKIGIANAKDILKKLILWIGGYGGMWCGKWLAGSLLTQKNMFASAINQAILRASSIDDEVRGGVEFSRLYAVFKNIGVFLKWPFFILFLIGIGYWLFQLRKITFRILQQEISVIIIYFAIALLPAGWIFVVANHSYIHYWFTSKEFCIAAFSLLSLGIYLKNLCYDRDV